MTRVRPVSAGEGNTFYESKITIWDLNTIIKNAHNSKCLQPTHTITPNCAVLSCDSGSGFIVYTSDKGRCFHVNTSVPLKKLKAQTRTYAHAHTHAINALTNVKVTEVFCGDRHLACVDDVGHVYLLGANNRGQLGNGQRKDVPIISTHTSNQMRSQVPTPLFTNRIVISYVSCGPRHTLIVTATGSLYAFGDGREGCLGNSRFAVVTTPTLVSLGTNTNGDVHRVFCAAAGHSHSAAVTYEGEVFTWGNNSNGQLGVGHTRRLLKPTHVPNASISNIRIHT